MNSLVQNPKFLISGFEPFAGDLYNPSSGYVDYIDSNSLFKHRAIKLPVTYTCYEILKEEILNYQPDIVIMLGLAKERANINIETNCYNQTDLFLKDENGQLPSSDNALLTYQELMRAKSIYYHFSEQDLNLKLLTTNLNEFSKLATSEKIELSSDPGRYICNFIYFMTLFDATIRKKFTPQPLVIFIHLPATQEIKETGWKKEELFQKVNELLNKISEIE